MLRRVDRPGIARSFSGRLDGIEAGVVAGWARDEAAPARKVVVEIVWNGIRVGLAVADHPAGGARGDDPEAAFSAFRFALPGHLVAEGGEVRARVANTDVDLGGIVIGAAGAAPPGAGRADDDGERE